jgi:hypothetical protein
MDATELANVIVDITAPLLAHPGIGIEHMMMRTPSSWSSAAADLVNMLSAELNPAT